MPLVILTASVFSVQSSGNTHMSKSTKYNAAMAAISAATQQQILQAAVELAGIHGYQHFTRNQVAERANVAQGAVHYHYGTMQQLRRAVMGEAVRTRNLKIIAMGLAAGDTRARKAPEDVRRQAVELMMVG